MPDISGINYNGVKPRPTFEELINFKDYPIKYPDRTATFIRDSPLLTQLDGLGMMELEEMERKERIERYKDDLIRQIAQNTGQPAQVLRAVNRRQFVPNAASLADSRTDSDYQDISDEIDSQRSDINDSLLGRIRAMVDESSSSISNSNDVGSILTNLSQSASVRQLLDTPAGFRLPVHTGSGDLALVPSGSGELHPKPDQITNLRLTREQLEAMHDTDLDWEMYGYGIDYGKNTTREYKIRKILEAQAMMGDFIEMRPRSLNPPPPPKTQYFPLTLPPPKAKMFPTTPPPPPPKTQYQLFPMTPTSAHTIFQTPSSAHTIFPMTPEQARKALSPPTTRTPNWPTPPIVIPNLNPEDDNYRHPEASGSGPGEPAEESAAAAAVQRRPVPSGGLTMQLLRDYSEDELDAELRALGIYTGNTPLYEKRKMIVNYYDTLRRGGKPLPISKPPSKSLGSLRQPSDAIIHDLSILSGLEPENIRQIFDWNVKDLKLELQSRGVYIRSNATKLELVKEVVKRFGIDLMSSKGSPMSVDSP